MWGTGANAMAEGAVVPVPAGLSRKGLCAAYDGKCHGCKLPLTNESAAVTDDGKKEKSVNKVGI